MKNYLPVSVLQVCGEVFERLLYNNMFSFFSENDLISAKQSGFRPGDSCNNQLISVAHEIYTSFDDGHEVRVSFSIYLKRLIDFGMNACFSSYSKKGYRES